jgi:hypothetical protein
MSGSDRFAVLILDGSTAYNSIGIFNRELARVVRTTGLDVFMLNIDDAEAFNATLRQVMADYPERIAMCLSFSGFGVELGDTSGNGNLWQRLKIPMLSFMLDHPAYYLARHKTPTPAIMRVYPNRDFLEFHRDHVRSPYRTAYLPFGAMTYGREPRRREPKPGEAPLIVFPKTGCDPQSLREPWKFLPRLMQRVINDSIDHYWGETARSGSVSPSVLAAADAAGIELRNDLVLFTFFIAQVDDYIRKSKVDILARKILPLPVKIYGGGLEYLDTTGAKAEILPPVDYDKLIDIFGASLAVVSMNQNIDDECHDRPYSALGSGAMPISDINPWWAKNYPALLPYSYDFRDRSVAAAVEKVLADPAAAAEIAWTESGRQIKKRTFDTMVMEALELAIMHRYFTFNFRPPQLYYRKCGD